MAKKKSADEMDEAIAQAEDCHIIWHKFEKFIANAFGKDLRGKLHVSKFKIKETGKTVIFKYRDFNEYELSKRLVGYEVMCRIKKWVDRYCPEIRIAHCDDALYAGSDILLIPHPNHGIRIMFIPQCTGIQNQFFLYEGHYKNLMKELKEMRKVYKPIK